MGATRSTPARDRLLDAADTLFSHGGIRATGIDEIIARAGVAKASLYNNFSAKDDLVVAYLTRRLDALSQTTRSLNERFQGPERVTAFFELVTEHARRPDFAGCPFARAALDVAPHSTAGRVVATFYRDLVDFFAQATGRSSADELMTWLVNCYDGAMLGSYVRRDPDVARRTQHLVAHLLRVTRHA